MSRLHTRLGLGLIALAAVLAPAPVTAQDDATALLGAWESTMDTPRGSFTQTYTFEMEDGALVGTVSGGMGGGGMDAELTDLTFEDGTVSFEVVRSMRGNTMTQTVTATIEGDVMEGTMSGGRGGDRPFTARRST